MLAGVTIGDYLHALVECNACITAVSLVTYTEPPTIELRAGLSGKDFARRDHALALRQRDGLPFWDAAMLSCFDHPETPDGLLSAALFHQFMESNRKVVLRSDFLAGNAPVAVSDRSSALAFGSAIEINNQGGFHLPLLDFHCRESTENDRLVHSTCNLLFPCTTVVCRSGESYHAYGLRAIPSEQLVRFLARALLFAPIVDRAYVAHQLIERQCMLRISASASKPCCPQVKFIARP